MEPGHGSVPDAVGEISVVLTTEQDDALATALARRLLASRAAACVSLLEIRSLYRWEGEVTDSSEVQLVVKTTRGGARGVLAIIAEHHSYDLPEIVVLDASASSSYARWVADEVR